MGTILNFPGLDAPSAWAMPTILTAALIERMSRVNQTSRTLREFGYRIVDQDISPNDDGSPIVQIDLNGVSTRALQLLAECAVRNTTSGVERITIGGVRVFWQRSA